MQVQISARELEDCLIYIHKAVVRTKSVISSSIGVQFLFKDGILRLYSSNGVQPCEVTFGAIACSNFNCVLEFSVLYKIVSLSESGMLELTFESDSLSIVSGKNEYNLVYLTERDYSLLINDVKVEDTPIAEIPIAELRKAVLFLSMCMPSTAMYSHFRGVNFDGNLAATNTHGFAYYTMNLTIAEPLFIAIESFNLLAGMEIADDTILLHKNGNRVIASVGRARYFISLMANTFPKYDRIIQRLNKHTHTVNIPKDLFLKACKKLSSFTDADRKNAVFITVNAEEVSLAARAETRKGKEVIAVETENISNEVSFSVNLVDILGYATRVSDTIVRLSFNDTIDDYAIRDGGAWYIDRTLKI